MSRSYRAIRPKGHRVYTVDEVLALYGISRNTLSTWIKAGLRPTDNTRPQLFRGAELRWFHEQRALNSKRQLRAGEFKCCACKARVYPVIGTMRIEPPLRSRFWAIAACPGCGSTLRKILNETECDRLRKCVESNTNPRATDEGNAPVPAGVGNKPGKTCPSWTPENERIVHAYQIYAQRFDQKTLDAHLASISDFESFIGARKLVSVTPQMASDYREYLIAGGRSNLSRSTLCHRASHLRTFFGWLVQQDGYRRMNKTIGEYFTLPKRQAVRALQPAPRAIPTTEQVHAMISLTPAVTRLQRRDRAIICCSFLFGSRANATASLRLKHLGAHEEKIIQDATEVRVKNGRSQVTSMFPIGEPAGRFFREWVAELRQLGFGPQDALFPPDAALASPCFLSILSRRPVVPWKTDDPIRRAFGRACKHAGLPYFNPHSAKHFLKSVRDDYCRTPEHRKAWSHNLGHENEQTTEASYAKMTDQRRDEIFGDLLAGDVESEEEKDLLLAYYEYCLIPGTPEFERAEMISQARRERRKVTGMTLALSQPDACRASSSVSVTSPAFIVVHNFQAMM